MRPLILAILPLVLAGCVEEEPACCAPNPSDSMGPAEIARVDSGQAYIGWLLRHDGIGPLRVGMTVEEARSALGGDFVAPGPDAGMSDSPEACQYARSGRFPPGVWVMLEGLRVVRVEVDSGAVGTAQGVRIGQSEAHVRRVYPGRVTEMPHKYSDGKYLLVRAAEPSDTTHLILFETDGEGVVRRIRGGQRPQVEYVEGCA